MKIAISSSENKFSGLIDQRFGRCPFFLLFEDIKPIEIIENEGAIQGHGAAIKAASQMGEHGVEVVITGELGPNATSALSEMNIKAYNASGPADEALKKYLNGELTEISKVSPPHPTVKKKDGERVFFPLLEDSGMDSKISTHFGHAPFFGVYDLEKKELKVIENDLNHTDPTKSPIDQIEEAVNPTIIFAIGIGGRAINIISEKGISLKTGPFGIVKEVIEHWEDLDELTEDCGHKY